MTPLPTPSATLSAGATPSATPSFAFDFWQFSGLLQGGGGGSADGTEPSTQPSPTAGPLIDTTSAQSGDALTTFIKKDSSLYMMVGAGVALAAAVAGFVVVRRRRRRRQQARTRAARTAAGTAPGGGDADAVTWTSPTPFQSGNPFFAGAANVNPLVRAGRGASGARASEGGDDDDVVVGSPRDGPRGPRHSRAASMAAESRGTIVDESETAFVDTAEPAQLPSLGTNPLLVHTAAFKGKSEAIASRQATARRASMKAAAMRAPSETRAPRLTKGVTKRQFQPVMSTLGGGGSGAAGNPLMALSGIRAGGLPGAVAPAGAPGRAPGAASSAAVRAPLRFGNLVMSGTDTDGDDPFAAELTLRRQRPSISVVSDTTQDEEEDEDAVQYQAANPLAGRRSFAREASGASMSSFATASAPATSLAREDSSGSWAPAGFSASPAARSRGRGRGALKPATSVQVHGGRIVGRA
jgi:hypothetical protein